MRQQSQEIRSIRQCQQIERKLLINFHMLCGQRYYLGSSPSCCTEYRKEGSAGPDFFTFDFLIFHEYVEKYEQFKISIHMNFLC